LPYGSLSLAGALLAYHVPRKYQDGLDSACSPVILHLRQEKGEFLRLFTCLFGSSLQANAYQHLWLVPIHDVYQQFTYVSHIIQS
jgi:hypothetical protein